MRRWEDLRPELDARGVRIVTVCTDTPEQIRRGRRKHGLQAVMLSDPDLALTDRFGLRNRGPHMAAPGAPPALPVPTTLLVDASGVVRWMDSSDNYQRRSDAGRVRSALERHLP